MTHLRKQGIDKAKQGGASREDISQQTGHGKESIDVSYLPDLPPDVMHVAAGLSLRHGETMYFVSRVFIRFDDPELPFDCEQSERFRCRTSRNDIFALSEMAERA